MDLDALVARRVKVMAALDDMTPQDYMRRALDLNFKSPQRPRLSLSLGDEDYQRLGQRYGLDPDQKTEIKRRIIAEVEKLAREDS